MPRSERADGPKVISQADPAYPARLTFRLGESAPKTISIVGSSAPLSSPLTAYLCSKETPGATILKAFDQAAAWRDTGCCVISGFHSPLERQCLDILLRGKQPVVMMLARGLGVLRLPAEQRKAVEEGRLTIISPFSVTVKRVNAALAHERNRFVAAMSDETVFAYISYGSSLSTIEYEAKRWGSSTRQLHG